MFKEKSASNILKGLIKGSIKINRTEEYKMLLAEYPNNPFVGRLLADFLKNKRSFADAIKRYHETFELFMAEGQTLHAIASLFELWKIITPTPYDFRSLHSKLRRRNSHNSLIAECFALMSYQELRATISRLEKIRLKPDETIEHRADSEESLYFVVSGELVKSPTETDSKKYSRVQFLKANDHFSDGNLFEEEGLTPCQVMAANNVELLKITKEHLFILCEEHPALKSGIRKLIRQQLSPDSEKPEKFLRKTSRRQLSISLDIVIMDPKPGRRPISVRGFTSDISLGGSCVIVDPNYRDFPCDDILGRTIKLRVSLPDESITVSIMGSISWSRETKIKGQRTSAIGVKFCEAPPRVRASMLIFVNSLGSINPATT